MEASNAGGVTPEDFAKLQAMAEQATKTAEEAKTLAEAKENVAEAVIEEGEAQGIKVDQATAEMIANVTISQMEARGAFGQAAEEPAAPPEVPPGEVAPAAPPVAEVPPVPEAAPPVNPEDEAFQPPKKKTLAERFQGK